MAVADDGAPPCSFYGSYDDMLEEASPSPIQLGSLSSNPCSALYSLQQDHYHYSPPLSSSGSSHPQPDEPHSPNKTTTSFLGGSFLSFQPQNCYNFGHPHTIWDQDHSHKDILVDAAGGGDWLYGDGATPLVAQHQSPPPLKPTSKRPLMKEENMQILIKKQCTRRQPNKPKPSKSAKDPQSIAAKTRRERISERLKILQDLVPNGSKVDLVTMLEKATSYVQFLQLQVKVLATDEFWPAGGGRLPDITQVREAIDAILSTRRNNDNHNNNNHTTPSNEKEMEEIIDSD